jgi:hypothetical protein
VVRSWREISYHEQLGIAKVALERGGDLPTLAIKEMFNLSRLNKSTETEFLSWVENYEKYKNKSSPY